MSPKVSTVEEGSDGFKTVTYRKKTITGTLAVLLLNIVGSLLLECGTLLPYQLFQRRKGSRLFSFPDLP
jgi:hypothetical protein